jgi:hypothetical protein
MRRQVIETEESSVARPSRCDDDVPASGLSTAAYAVRGEIDRSVTCALVSRLVRYACLAAYRSPKPTRSPVTLVDVGPPAGRRRIIDHGHSVGLSLRHLIGGMLSTGMLADQHERGQTGEIAAYTVMTTALSLGDDRGRGGSCCT